MNPQKSYHHVRETNTPVSGISTSMAVGRMNPAIILYNFPEGLHAANVGLVGCSFSMTIIHNVLQL